MVKREVIYQHFHPSEGAFIDRLFDVIEQMEATYAYQLTEFLDPRQVEIARSVLGQAGVCYYESSLICSMEYRRLIVAPDYYVLDLADFEMVLLEISYPTKFYELGHRQIMGALLHQLGLKRSVFGDILVKDQRAQVIFDQAKLTYLLNQVDKIGRVPVSFQTLDFEQALVAEEGTDSVILASSLRLDKILALVLKLSRVKAGKLIEQGRIKRNHALVKSGRQAVELGDLISVRGYGRFQVKESLGISKQGKQKLVISQMIK